jgi:signal transduction histidine kinase
VQNIPNSDKELGCIAGAYGAVESVPLLGDLIGPGLLNMVVVACRNLGFPSGILQNDGTVFPTEGRVDLFTPYCQHIRSTGRGRMRCRACDCQAVIEFTGGNHAGLESDLEVIIRNFPVHPVKELGLLEEKVYCYGCHAGLLELVRAISLDFSERSLTPIGAIWAGQNKVEGYSLRDKEVWDLAREIEYANPDTLVRLYRKIRGIDAKELSGRARSLAETARPIEDSASASFHVKKQGQFDRVSNEVLSNVRTSLAHITTTSTKTIQKQIYGTIAPSLEVITGNIGNCYSAICEVSAPEDQTKDSRIEVRILAQGGVRRREADKINIRQTDLEKVLAGFESGAELKSFCLANSDWELLTKLKNAIQISDITHAIVGRIPGLQNNILWITLLRSNCAVLTPTGNPLPHFIRMFESLLQGTTQIIKGAYLLAKEQDSVRTLEKQAKELAQKDIQTRLLIENLAHQVSRPIMELKQSAYILSLGFSKDAYASFRACLGELARGCRNFDMYTTLTTDSGNRGIDLQTSSSLDVMQIVNQSYERVKPLSQVERIEVFINTDIEKGHSIPKVVGNPRAILEAVVNVFHNAIKYSIGCYPVELEISCGQSSTVDIRVSNVGIELPEKDWERIFEETYRADTAKEVAIEGSGLGLYVARKLVALHGGAIKVESCVPGKPLDDGSPRWKTTFIISLKC